MKEIVGNNTFPATVPAPQDGISPLAEVTFDQFLQALADRTEWLKQNKEDRFPAGTKMVFVQPTAPVGWVLDVTANHAAGLRIVTDGTGGQAGGSADAFASHAHSIPAHGHQDNFSVYTHYLVVSELPPHNHRIGNSSSAGTITGVQFYGEAGGSENENPSYTYNTGGVSSGHNHTLDGKVTDAGASESGYFSPKFQNAIVCVKA